MSYLTFVEENEPKRSHLYLFSGSKNLLDDIEIQIANLTDEIPLSALKNISDTLVEVHRDITKLIPELVYRTLNATDISGSGVKQI